MKNATTSPQTPTRDSVTSSGLLACLRYHKKRAKFYRELLPSMTTKKWQGKVRYGADKHERFIRALKQANDRDQGRSPAPDAAETKTGNG